jgi:CRP-like cAMP-binding protein
MNSSLIKILTNIPILSDIEESDLAEITNMVNLKTFPKDSYIFKEGDKGDEFYVIKSGKVKILRNNEEGREKSIALLYPDNFFGEMTLLSEKPRNSSAKTVDECELYSFKKNNFFNFLFL